MSHKTSSLIKTQSDGDVESKHNIAKFVLQIDRNIDTVTTSLDGSTVDTLIRRVHFIFDSNNCLQQFFNSFYPESHIVST